MPWLSVNHTWLCAVSAVPTPLFALEVQRAAIPGAPGAGQTRSAIRISAPGRCAPQSALAAHRLARGEAGVHRGEQRSDRGLAAARDAHHDYGADHARAISR